MSNSLKILKDMMSNHKPIVINYGKGFISDKEVKELATWDDTIKAYTSATGVWDAKLLYQIANGEVKNTSIEIGE